MNKFPKVTVIIPIYNVENYLTSCLDSIIHQSYENLEIICIDNGSTDNCPKILKDYKIKDSRIKLLNSEKGVSKARNKGLDNATGEWITFVDSDDVIHCDYVKNLLQAAIDNMVDFAWCKHNKIIKDDKFITNENKKYIVKENLLELFVNYTDILGYAVWGKIYSIKSIANLRFPENIAIAEDKIFNLNYVINNNSGVFVEQGLYDYRIRENSAINQININKHLQIIEGEKYCINFAEKNVLDKYLKEKIIKKSISEIYKSAIIRPYKDIPHMCYKNWKKTLLICFDIFENNNITKYLSLKRKILLYLFLNQHFKLLKFLL